VSCEAFYKNSKILTVANVTIKDKAAGWHGTLEYTYSESHSTTTPNGAGGSVTMFATESRTITGQFDATTDNMGWGSVDGTGTGKAALVNTDGMRNPLCSKDGGSTVSGDVRISAGGSAGSGAGTLSISAHGDKLDGEQHLDDRCPKPPVHQKSAWSAAYGVTCDFVGIDFTKGGTYEADVPIDNGHGKCKLTIAPR